MPYWKNGVAWEAIPASALAGTYGGTCHVEHPEARDVDGNGLPCGAVGRPQVVLTSPWMTDTGMGFWRTKFASASATYAAISVQVWDPRLGAETKYAGKLHWPTWTSVGQGSTAAKTVYRGVRIVIGELETTT